MNPAALAFNDENAQPGGSNYVVSDMMNSCMVSSASGMSRARSMRAAYTAASTTGLNEIKYARHPGDIKMINYVLCT